MTRNWMGLIMLTALGAVAGCAAPQASGPVSGTPASLGNGSVSSYAEMDAAGAPKVIGVMFSASALENLPSGTDMHQCAPNARTGRIDPAKDCVIGHERVLPLPSDTARRGDMPFKWALVNWNPQGHIPPGIYDVPHFDVHFMIEPIENIFAIQPGGCGPEHVRCDQFPIGRKPLPANYIPASHIDVGAVVPAMGNHMVDVGGTEFKGQKFTHSFIFGSYDGRITFYEKMLTRAYMLSKPAECTAIPQPEAVAVTGYYPTQSCTRYDAAKDAYSVSLEGFQLRQASAPGPLRAIPPLPPGPPTGGGGGRHGAHG